MNTHLKKPAREFQAGESSGFNIQFGERYYDRKSSKNEWTNYSAVATDAVLAEIRAQGAEACVSALVKSDDDDFTDAPNICAMVAFQLRKESVK